MKEPNDDDLILYYYDEAPDSKEIRQALEASPALQVRYAGLVQALELASATLEVPERPDSYGAEVWARIEHRLAPGEAPSTPLRDRVGDLRAFPSTPLRERVGRFAGLAAAALVLLAAGFLFGRFWTPSAGDRIASAPVGPLPAAARERILARTVADHLERSERLFTELANAHGEGSVDVAAERRWAHDLLAANRLYRQSTLQGGRPQLASLLDELEPFLIELSHGPDEIPAAELADFRHRFEERALLFKMRVVGARLSGPQTL